MNAIAFSNFVRYFLINEIKILPAAGAAAPATAAAGAAPTPLPTLVISFLISQDSRA